VNAALRSARPTDAGTAGQILWQNQRDSDWLPDLYSAAETIGFCGVMIDRGWVTVAVIDDRVQGFLARDGTEICGLYLSPEVRGRGVGRCLIEDAKCRSGLLHLRAFQANTNAQRFYRRAGFVSVSRGIGAENDENLPDIAYVWRKEAAQ